MTVRLGAAGAAGNAAIAAFVVVLALGGHARADEDTTFRVYWKEGLRLDTADKKFRMQIGGRIMNDHAFFDFDNEMERVIEQVNGLDAGKGDVDDGTEFRRARLYMTGEIYDRIIFKAQFDFAGGDTDFRDVYMGVKNVPVFGTVKVGHFKEPFSIEQLTSSKYITFMERALPDAFAPARNTGVGFRSTALDERITGAAGVFWESEDDGDSSEEGYGVSARLTGLPWYADEGRKLLHVGIATSHRDRDGTTRFRQRPEAHLSNQLVNTGSFDADDYFLLGVEAALVIGPFSVQAEYMNVEINLDDDVVGDDPTFSGWYAYASYFVTGEHRAYKKSAAAFDRVRPARSFLDGGPGALEVAVRYSSIDLSDESIDGGELDDVTVGLNWYLNPNLRVMFNYVIVDVEFDGDGAGVAGADPPAFVEDADGSVAQIRFQIDF